MDANMARGKRSQSSIHNPRPGRARSEDHIPRPINGYVLAQISFNDLLNDRLSSASDAQGILQLYESSPRVLQRLQELLCVWKQRYPDEPKPKEKSSEKQDSKGEMKTFTKCFGKLWREDFTLEDKDDWKRHCNGWIKAKFDVKYPNYKYHPGPSRRKVRKVAGKNDIVTRTTQSTASIQHHEGHLPAVDVANSSADPSQPSRSTSSKRVREEDDDETVQSEPKRARKSHSRSSYPRRIQLPVVPVLPSPALSIAPASTSHSPFTPTVQTIPAHFSPATFSRPLSAMYAMGTRISRSSPTTTATPFDGVDGALPRPQMFPELDGVPYCRETRPVVVPSFTWYSYAPSTPIEARPHATPLQSVQPCVPSSPRDAQPPVNNVLAFDGSGMAFPSDAESGPTTNNAFADTAYSLIPPLVGENLPSYNTYDHALDHASLYGYPAPGELDSSAHLAADTRPFDGSGQGYPAEYTDPITGAGFSASTLQGAPAEHLQSEYPGIYALGNLMPFGPDTTTSNLAFEPYPTHAPSSQLQLAAD